MQTPWTPTILSELRKLPCDALLQMRLEAVKTIKLHNQIAKDAFGGPAGYLSIPQVDAEIWACKTEIDHIDQLLTEWGVLVENGKKIQRVERMLM